MDLFDVIVDWVKEKEWKVSIHKNEFSNIYLGYIKLNEYRRSFYAFHVYHDHVIISDNQKYYATDPQFFNKLEKHVNSYCSMSLFIVILKYTPNMI